MNSMRMFSLLLSSVFATSAMAESFNGRVENLATGQILTREQLYQELSQHHLIVIGEKHYTQKVQDEEGRILSEYSLRRKPKSLVLGWEFLAWTKQDLTATAYKEFTSNLITVIDFFSKTIGKANEYAPLLEAAKTESAHLVGLNLTREEKAPVTQHGLSALDPKLLPQGFELGGAEYRERFEIAMGGHTDPTTIENYFTSQCLTDDVMAVQTLESLKQTEGMVVVMGSFHSDYYDGTYARIKTRQPDVDAVSVRIIDASDFTEPELKDYLRNPKYGLVADYAIFISEPYIEKGP